MLEIADRLLAAHDAGRTLVVATAIDVEGSAPRTVGTSMAFDGTAVIGSIAGGCVEGAVVDVCEQVLADGVARTVVYGVTDASAFEVGLSCGGQVRVHVQPLSAELIAGLRSAVAGEATSLDVCAEFTESVRPPAHLIIFGAMEFSAALSVAAQALEFRVTVCDPRPLFTTAERFPDAQLVIEWPPSYLAEVARTIDENTVVCILSHDERFDAEVIELALASPAGYVGAMGSRVTHERRLVALRARGIAELSLARLHAPIGLDLGATTPAETAISILAEVLAVRAGASARPLTTGSGRIHGQPSNAVR
jgi:xanthine dehydrogenase accessory factor